MDRKSIIVELTSKTPFIIKQDKSFDCHEADLLDKLNAIGCKCMLHGPTYNDIINNEPYLFKASFEGIRYNPKTKEYSTAYTSSNSTPGLTFSSLMRAIKDNLSNGFHFAAMKEKVDFKDLNWYAYDKQSDVFKPVPTE